MNQKEEVENFQYPVLGLDICDMLDYDPSLPPKNGNQYLYNVMSEAAKCPSTVRADMSLLRPKLKKQTVFIEMEVLPKCNPDLLPSTDWEQIQVADFSTVRQLISRRRFLQPDLTEEGDVILPEVSDEKRWKEYCFETEHLPVLSVLLSLNQVKLEGLLNNLIGWLAKGEIGFSGRAALWLYSVVACVETPLLPEVCSSFRTLARLCIVERSKIVGVEDEMLNPLNLLICIVTRYFEQYDLLL